MQTKRFKTTLIFVLTLPVLAMQSGLGLARQVSPPSSYQPLRQVIFISQTSAFADFDGDQIIDQAELAPNGQQKSIHLRYSAPWTASLHFTTATLQDGRLHAEDIDHDRDNDLIWIPKDHPEQAALWLNNGVGEFTRKSDPAAYQKDFRRLAMDAGAESKLTGKQRERLLAAGTGAGICLPRTKSAPVVLRREILSDLFSPSCRALLSPGLACHPKRGPPHHLP